MSQSIYDAKWNGMLLGIQREADDVVTLRVIYEQQQKEREEAARKEREERHEQWLREQAERGDGFGTFNFDSYSSSSDHSFAESPKVEPVIPPARELGRLLMRLIVPQKQGQPSDENDTFEKNEE